MGNRNINAILFPGLLILATHSNFGLAQNNSQLVSLYHQRISPEIIGDVPAKVLYVSFGKNGYDVNNAVNFGNEMTTAQTRNKPSVVAWVNPNPNKFYLVQMTDPDVPSKALPILGEVVHWMVGNIPGGNLQAGETLVDYSPPSPPPFSGLHRYLLLLFEQERKINFNRNRHPSNFFPTRVLFKTKSFSSLFGLGEPIAANFFTVRG